MSVRRKLAPEALHNGPDLASPKRKEASTERAQDAVPANIAGKLGTPYSLTPPKEEERLLAPSSIACRVSGFSSRKGTS